MSSTNGRSMENWVETTDEDGTVHYFEKVEEFEVEGKDYALLIYQGTEEDQEEEDQEEEDGDDAKADGEDDEDEAGFDEEYVVMRITHEDDGDVYEQIDDEAEFQKVVAVLEAMDYEFDATDDDDEEGHVHGPGCKHGHDGDDDDGEVVELKHIETDN